MTDKSASCSCIGVLGIVACIGGARALNGCGFLGGSTLAYKFLDLDLVIIWFMAGVKFSLGLSVGEGSSLAARFTFCKPSLRELIMDLIPLFHGPGRLVVASESDE